MTQEIRPFPDVATPPIPDHVRAYYNAIASFVQYNPGASEFRLKFLALATTWWALATGAAALERATHSLDEIAQAIRERGGSS